MLAIEWKSDGARVLRLRTGPGGPRVLDARSLSPDELVGWLARHRREEIRVAAHFTKSLQKVLTLPALRDALPAMIAQEVETQLGAPAAASWVELGVEEIDGEPQVRVFAGGVATGELDLVASVLREAGVEPALVTSVPFAIHDLLVERGGAGSEPCALLDADATQCTLYVVCGAEIRVVRTLPYGVGLDPSALGTLARDIRQTFAFHASKFRGEPIARFLVAGALAAPQHLAALGADLEVTPEALQLPEFLARASSDALVSFTAALAVACLDQDRFAHAWVAPALVAVRRARRTARGLTLALAGCGLAVAVPGALLSRHARLLFVHRATASREIVRTETWLRGQGDRMILREVHGVQPAWDQLLRDLAMATPPGVVLRTLVVKRTAGGWSGTAEGEVPQRAPVDALLLTETLRSRLAGATSVGAVAIEPNLDESTLRFRVRFEIAPREVAA